jgi:hypothetical protein
VQCDECGCNTIRQETFKGLVFGECTLCGHRHADSRTLDILGEYEWAGENGVDEAIQPLVFALRRIKGVRYMDSSGGDCGLGLMPSVYFQLAPGSYHYLQKLTQLLDAFVTRRHKWIVEVSSRMGVSFWLRPFLPVTTRKPTAAEIEGAKGDVPVLAETIERNARLTWWEQ